MNASTTKEKTMSTLARRRIVPRRLSQRKTASLPTRPRKPLPTSIAEAVSTLDTIPLAGHMEYDLSEKECIKFRQQVYARNKVGPHLFMTRRFGRILWVWKVS